MSKTILEAKNVSKKYENGFEALKNVSLDIHEGEIFALLGPNGAGKTTLINMACGVVKISAGTIAVDGFDVVRNYRKARATIGLVPQEMLFDLFLTTEQTIRYARGFFGKPQDLELEEKVLKSLSLWDKRQNKIMALSGGMKRRTIIAKALMNEPKVLFLDEPSAGVDVELRQGMWDMIRGLKKQGTTIVLTTHYLEEAELLADRIGIINHGEIKLVEEKSSLMKRLGGKTLNIHLKKQLDTIPASLENYQLKLSDDAMTLSYAYGEDKKFAIASFINDLKESNVEFEDVETSQRKLEDIFLSLVSDK